ncbi:MAG: hypothetical protein D6811_04165 [Alphaproteobacteria bacterium]|nr:MAG: hypothetical protein D6811_04165 [Alphaproteobacteria bacterium]
MGLAGAALAAGGLVMAAPAFAEGMGVRDYGEVVDRPTCLARAEAAMRAYLRQHGITNPDHVVPTEWTVYGWDFPPGNNDIVVMCPVVAGGVINAFFFQHGQGSPEERQQMGDALEALWNVAVGSGAGATGGGGGKKGGKSGKKSR